MLIVETIAKIRRLHFTEGKGIKTICRDLKLSKKVVRKVIRTGITEFTIPGRCSRARSWAPGWGSSTGCWRSTRLVGAGNA